MDYRLWTNFYEPSTMNLFAINYEPTRLLQRRVVLLFQEISVR